MKILTVIAVFVGLSATIGGLTMLIVPSGGDDRLIGGALLAGGLTYFWYCTGFRGLMSNAKPHAVHGPSFLGLSEPELIQRLLAALGDLGRTEKEGSPLSPESALRLLLDHPDTSEVLKALLKRSRRLAVLLGASEDQASAGRF